MPRRWTITRAEFDGWAARVAPVRLWSSVAVWIAAGMLVAAQFATVTLADGLPMRIFAVLIGLWCLSNLVGLARTMRWNRRLAAATDRIWEADGAVCPRCLATLGEVPCPHGLVAADADELRATWEATARGDVAGWMRMNALVARRRPARGPVALWRLFREHAATAPFDPDRPLWRRFAGAILGFGVAMGGFMTLLGWASWGGEPSVATFVGYTLQFGLGFGGMMIAATSWSGVRAGANRCGGCGHLVAPGGVGEHGAAGDRCGECGADLRAAGAVISHEKRRDARTAVGAGAIAAIAFCAPIVLSTTLVAGALPTGALLLQYRFAQPHARFGIVRELSTRTLDAAATAAVAYTLIAHASTTPGSALLDSDFLGNALLRGAIDAETAGRALRASAAVRIDAPDRVRAGEPFEVAVVPELGTDLFSMTHMTLVTWRGIETDGAFLASPAPFLSHGSMDPKRPAARPPAPVAVTIASPGEHRLRVRAWAVAVPFVGTLPKSPEFDAEGRLVPPAGAPGATEIVVERTVVVE